MSGNRLTTAAALVGLVFGLGGGMAWAQGGGGLSIPPPPGYSTPGESEKASGELTEALPQLVIGETTYDAGTVWQGEDVRAEFTVRNEGTENLTLKMVKKSCGCTAVDIPNKLVPPGTSTPVTVTVTTRGKRSRFSVNATLGTNDPLMPEVNLTIKGDAKPFVDIQPQPSAIFGRVESGSSVNKEFTLRGNLEDEPLQILGVQFDSDKFESKLETIEEGRTYKLVISTAPPLKRGANNGTCIIDTSYEKEPQLRIRCSAYVPERLALRPSRLTLSSPTTFADAQRVIYLQDEGEKKAEIVSIRTTSEDITVDTEEHPSGRGYRLTINVKPGLEIPNEGHSVFVETNDEEYRVLELQIMPRRQRVPTPQQTISPQQPPKIVPQQKPPTIPQPPGGQTDK
jgi:hypothetical protein